MPDKYEPSNWYWTVANDDTKAYSSAAGDYVQPSNAAFVAWVNRGNFPTRIASEAELGEVLAQYQLRPAAANVLDGYQDAHSRKLTIEIVAKILLWLVNEVRTLKGQPTVTAAQFRTFVKSLM